MKKSGVILALILSVAVFSCRDSASINSDNVNYYKSTVVVTEKIGDGKEEGYPEDLVSLFEPVEFFCEEKFFFSKPSTVVRLSKNEYKKDLKILEANATNFRNHKNRVKAFFLKGDGKNIGKELSKENEIDINQSQLLQSYISKLGKNDKYYYYSEDAASDSINGQKFYNNTDSLKFAISEYLCENSDHRIIIFYNPVSTGGVVTPALAPNKDNKEIKKETVKTSIKPIVKSERTQSNIGALTLSYANYEGERVSGKACGQGVMYFLETHAVPGDAKGTVAQRGQSVSGTWVKGKIVVGKLYDTDGRTVLATLMNGTEGDCN